MKELKDIVLKKGDIVYFDNGDITSVNGWAGANVGSLNYAGKITKVERPIKYKTIYERILDKEEKEYLEAVCKPFKDRVDVIKKYSLAKKNEYICIWLNKDHISKDYISFPYFKADTMYKGMELDKKYTLKELGLFEE